MNLSRRPLHLTRPATAAALLALMAPLAAACLPQDGNQSAPETVTTASAGPVSTAATSPPDGPGPTSTTAASTKATTTTSTTEEADPLAGAGDKSSAVLYDGLGLASWGDSYGDTMGRLSRVFGAPDAPGQEGGGFGNCGVTATRYVRWGDLEVMFFGRKGGPLVFAGYTWGDTQKLASGPHAAPVGPGSPVLGNEWGVKIGEKVDGDELLAAVKVNRPQATFLRNINGGDSAISLDATGSMRIVIDLHPTDGGDFLVEHLRAFDSHDITC
jgi:hypothetical protein